MKMKRFLLLIPLLPLLAFILVNGTQAACGDAAAPFVDWSGCDKTSDALAGSSLFAANLTGTIFTGADLEGVDMRMAAVNGADFTNAKLRNANLLQAVSFINVSFAGADIHGLNLGSTTIDSADFTGSTGIPQLNGTDINTSTCPDGTPSFTSSPYCLWTGPTFLSLIGVNAAALTNLWPLAVAGLLLAATAGLLLIRRSRELSEVTA